MASRQLFPKGVYLEVPRFPSGEIYTIESLESPQQISSADYKKIIKICNEPLLYKSLFEKKFRGKSYPPKAAHDFIRVAANSWHDGTWLVFFIRDPQKEIAAAIDLKAVEDDQAEIGYWASEKHSGIMTNTVNAICNLVKKAGLEYLYALVRPENKKSANILLRLHFIKTAKRRVDGKIHHVFARNL